MEENKTSQEQVQPGGEPPILEKLDDPFLVPEKDPGGLNLFLIASYIILLVWAIIYTLLFIRSWR